MDLRAVMGSAGVTVLFVTQTRSRAGAGRGVLQNLMMVSGDFIEY
jgi:hypothetical protein